MADNKILELVEIYLTKYAEQLVKNIKQQLTTKNKVASGNLVDSVTFNIKTDNEQISLQILTADYLKYIEDGRRPGAKQPPLTPIIKWIEVKKLPIPKNKKGIPKIESTAFAIAKSISVKGIKATPISQPALDETNKEFMNGLKKEVLKGVTEEIASNFTKDIIKGLTIKTK